MSGEREREETLRERERERLSVGVFLFFAALINSGLFSFFSQRLCLFLNSKMYKP